MANGKCKFLQVSFSFFSNMPPTCQVAASKLLKLVEKVKAYVKEHKHRPAQKRPRGSKLRVFSDCAGTSSETIALTLFGSQEVFYPCWWQ